MAHETDMPLPLWFLADAIVLEMEETPKVVIVNQDEKCICPVFFQESEATAFIRQVSLPGHCPIPIDDIDYLVRMFEVLRSGVLHEVHLFMRLPAGLNRLMFPADEFIRMLRVQSQKS